MVLETPVRRLRQITAAIRLRLMAGQRQTAMLAEWQTKALASFIVATSWGDKKDKEKLMGALDDLTALPRRRASTEAPSSEPQVGSSERLMMLFGRGGNVG